MTGFKCVNCGDFKLARVVPYSDPVQGEAYYWLRFVCICGAKMEACPLCGLPIHYDDEVGVVETCDCGEELRVCNWRDVKTRAKDVDM